MRFRDILLGVFAVATIVLASLTVGEYQQVSTLDSRLQSASGETLTSTTTVTSTAPCPSLTACGTFTYSQSDQVRVDSVQAMILLAAGGGEEDVQFAVGFENIGTSPVYFESYELNTSIAANSPVVREACNCFLGVSAEVDLSPGQNYTLYDPYSGDGYFYALLRGGTVNATFSFGWEAGDGANSTSNTTTVSAQFTFAAPPEP